MRNVASPIIVMDNENQILTTNEQAARLFQTGARATALSRRDQVAISNDAKKSEEERAAAAPGTLG